MVPIAFLKLVFLALYFTGTAGFQRVVNAAIAKHSSRMGVLSIPTNTHISPMNGNVLLKILKVPVNDYGLYIPRGAKGFQRGSVISVSQNSGKQLPSARTIDCADIRVGDELLYDKHIGETFLIDGVDHCVVEAGDVILKCSNDNPSLEEVHCLSEQLLVQIDEKSDNNSGQNSNIVTYRSKNAVPCSGTVVRVGKSVEGGAEVGQKVMFRYHSGVRELTIDGKQYVLLYQADVVAKW